MIEFDGLKLVNCTNKVLPIAVHNKPMDYIAFSPDGTICTIKVKRSPQMSDILTTAITYDSIKKDIRLSLDTYKEEYRVVDLPPAELDTLYVVTRDVARLISREYPNRGDFIYPSMSTIRRSEVIYGRAICAYDTFIHIAR